MWRRRIAMRAEKDAVTKDIERLTASDESAKKLQASLTEQRQKLTIELAGISKDREAIEKHLAQVEQLLTKARQLTAEVMAHNRQLAAQLAARQLRVRPAGNNGAGSSAKLPEPLALGRAN
jgi:chromosome segregation ATPase